MDSVKRHSGLNTFPESVKAEAARYAVAKLKEAILEGSELDENAVAAARAEELASPSLGSCINASGVVLHTGLGRARLARSAVRAIERVAKSHSVLEFDLESGRRGDRQAHVRSLLTQLTGAEDALVVNNCASAVLLVLEALCSESEVILSRGQMVEIGGSFRMPDIVRQSGCRLVEVGCTNKTHLSDYQTALNDQTAAILRCHPSNFAIIGFHEEPSLKELADLAHSHGIVLIDDAGSGCLLDTRRFGLIKEPTLNEAVRDGADVVTASGDKLLGGPQAGLILGSRSVIAKIQRHPLARAVRIDKLTLAGLEATLRLYRDGRELEIPIWNSLSRDLAAIKRTAQRWHRAAPNSVVARGETEVGGGSLPGSSVPTWRLGLLTTNPEATLSALRHYRPPIIGRIEDGTVWLDPRTVEPGEAAIVESALRNLP